MQQIVSVLFLFDEFVRDRPHRFTCHWKSCFLRLAVRLKTSSNLEGIPHSLQLSMGQSVKHSNERPFERKALELSLSKVEQLLAAVK